MTINEESNDDDESSIQNGELRRLRKVFETSSDLVKARWCEEFRDACGGIADLEEAHSHATAELEAWYREADDDYC